MKDFHEIGEARAEGYVCGDMLVCCECKRHFDPNKEDWITMSPDPYAPPVCEKCWNDDVKQGVVKQF